MKEMLKKARFNIRSRLDIDEVVGFVDGMIFMKENGVDIDSLKSRLPGIDKMGYLQGDYRASFHDLSADLLREGKMRVTGAYVAWGYGARKPCHPVYIDETVDNPRKND